MKKLTLLIIASFLCFSAFSQDIDLGIKGGPNYSSISAVPNSSSKTGFHAGIFAGIKVSDNFGVQVDFLYSQQGVQLDVGEFDLSYVNIPVVAKIFLVKGLNLQVGPQFGYVVDDKISLNIFKKVSEAEKSSISGIVGTGLDFPFGVRIDARYNFGLKDVVKGSDSKNNVFLLSLGYSFL